MKKVAVLMSSYNGSKYIDCQIESIIKQKDIEMMLYIRDDGSNDDTIEKIKNWIEKFPDKIQLFEGRNVGYIASFSELLRIVFNSNACYDYYSFADQDDYWENDKLIRGVEQLLTYDKESDDKPLLYASNTLRVDADLKPINLSWQPSNVNVTKGRALVQNFATGCTMIFNRKMADMYLSTYSDDISSHDFRMYQLCVFTGMFIWDAESRIKYRQHSSNQIGMPSFMGRMKNRIRNRKSKIHNFERQSMIFLRDCGKYLSDEDKKFVSKFCNYRKSVISRISLLFDRTIGYASVERDFFYRLKIILGVV